VRNVPEMMSVQPVVDRATIERALWFARVIFWIKPERSIQKTLRIPCLPGHLQTNVTTYLQSVPIGTTPNSAPHRRTVSIPPLVNPAQTNMVILRTCARAHASMTMCKTKTAVRQHARICLPSIRIELNSHGQLSRISSSISSASGQFMMIF